MTYYKEYSIERFDNPPSWEAPDGKRKNLLLGVPVYGISSDSILGNTFETDYYNTKESVAKLTDGKK
ncbi:MAG: hypothetical protein PHW77_04270, partial [Eubacteriales bacterium]|nr:hypothetical protein [Eubacteriales bacterium]